MHRYERMRNFFYVWCSKLFESVGHNVYAEGGFKPNLYTYYMWLVLVTFIVCAMYTFVFYDWFIRLNTVANLAVALQVSTNIKIDVE